VIFRATPLDGAWVLEPERHEDERGFFARTFCRREFAEHGLDPEVAQCSLSSSRRRGTLRGLHFQRAPHEEAKLVRCARGAIFDAIVDLRPGSPTFARSFTVLLDAEQRNLLYVPKGFAHGFLTLADDVEVCYQMSAPWAPGFEGGYRWDDPAFAIPWPEPPRVISERDRALPLLSEAPIERPAGAGPEDVE
jgi:dTDP-4-dehydrorhamnose 3,5-epimerase